MYGINRACVINPVNSIATVLLATQRHSIDIDDLIAQSALQHRLIENSPRLASIHIAGPVDRDQIERIARQKLIHIRRHELGDKARNLVGANVKQANNFDPPSLCLVPA